MSAQEASAQNELKKADESASNETQADSGSQGFSYSGGSTSGSKLGKLAGKGGMKGKVKKILPIVATLGIILLVVLFLGGNFIPDAILTRFIEETDVQYADGTQSKELVFQNAMQSGKIPSNTAERLEQEGVTVGYMEGDTFIASNISPALIASNDDGITIYGDDEKGDTALVLKMDDTIITANDFYDEIQHNVKLYDAFTKATYGRAAYYYDEKAQQVFKRIGTSRNNFSDDEDLDETMDKLMGDKNTVGFQDTTWHYMPVSWDIDPSTGVILKTYYDKVQDDFDCNGSNVSSIINWREPIIQAQYDPVDGAFLGYAVVGSTDMTIGEYGCNGANASGYMRSISQANMSPGSDEQTIKNTTDSLKSADTTSKEQKSMLLYAGFMESISRMKAGYGKASTETDKIIGAFGTMGATYGGSKINDVMNKLFETQTSRVVNIETGEEEELRGSMLEAPSVYAILAGEKVDLGDVQDFSSDRILYTIENKEGTTIDNDTMKKTLVTKTDKKSALGRFTNEDKDYAPGNQQITESMGNNYNHGNYSSSSLNSVELTINNSLYQTYNETVGISAGELLAEGAVNVGKELAKASGAAAGSKEAATAYLKLNNDVIAMDAEVDRMNRSPLDITSKNTFLGSIMYKFAVASIKSGGILNKVASLSRVTNFTIASLLPAAHADDDEPEAYLATFGNCKTLETIGAAGSPTCSMVATFDTTTYKGIYQNSEFQSFINENIECNGSNCKVKENSNLAMYVNYNEERNTPIGLSDAAIMEKYQIQKNEEGGVIGRIIGKIGSFFANLFKLTEGAENDPNSIPDEATGKAFVNSSSNHERWSDSGGPQYKYAQRYISLARAAETMRQYDGDETAYVFEGFGKGDPIARYINELYQDSVATNN